MELTKLISRPERKLLILKPHMKRDARAAIELARLFPDSEAIAVLRSWAERDARAAIALAKPRKP